ncbi:MAG TPA: transporter [Balneolales bacterium]|nr:transporter [Balneolales bacterium]
MAAGVIFFTLAAYGTLYAQEVAYTGSFQYSTGNYIFSDRTNSFYFFNGLNISGKGFQFSASIPVIYQNTPLISYTGGMMMPSGGQSGGSAINQQRGKGNRRGRVVIPFPSTQADQVGVGDPLIHLGISIFEQTAISPSFHIGASVKPPVASYDKGYGTGEWDYSAGISLSKRFGRTFILTNLDYWIFGDPPDLDLKNALSYGLALGNMLRSGKVGLLASLSGYTRIIQDVAPPTYLGLGLSYYITKKTSLNTNMSFGLSESTPDFTLSIGWRLGI